MHDNNTRTLVRHPTEPRLAFLNSLRDPAARQRTGRYLIEGIRHLVRALEDSAPIDSLFVAPDLLTHPLGRKLARNLEKSGTPVTRLSTSLYRALTQSAEPQGIGAILRQRWIPLASLRPGPASLYLVVDSIDLPGNLGTILRTAEAAGVSAVIITGSGVDPHDPAAVRATMGAIFSQTLTRCSPLELLRWARRRSVRLIGSSPSGLLHFRSSPYSRPAALLIGSERSGLSPQLLEACDVTLRIPMAGRGDSINAAVAAGILLYALSDPA